MSLNIYGDSNSQSFGDGVFIGRARIVTATDVSGEQVAFMKQPCDIGIQCTLDIGRDFMPTFTVGGNFKVDEAGKLDWGSAWKVRDFLSQTKCEVRSLDENNRLPAGTVESLIGKEFWRLTYVSGNNLETGKLKYSDFGQVGNIDKPAEELHKKWLKSVARGYPKNYAPDARENSPTFP